MARFPILRQGVPQAVCVVDAVEGRVDGLDRGDEHIFGEGRDKMRFAILVSIITQSPLPSSPLFALTYTSRFPVTMDTSSKRTFILSRGEKNFPFRFPKPFSSPGKLPKRFLRR